MMSAKRPLLEVHDLHAVRDDGGSGMVRGLSLHALENEIVCVIGPKGAGKSTLLRAIYGLATVLAGRVLFDDRDITAIRPPNSLRSAGIALVPQEQSIFPGMSVQDNLTLGMHLQRNRSLQREGIEYAYKLFPALRAQARRPAEGLGIVERRTLGFARALMWQPRLVLVDELSAGIEPAVSEALFSQLREQADRTNLTVLLAEREQNARQVLAISERGYVLDLGRQVFEGTGAELLPNVARRRSLLRHQA